MDGYFSSSGRSVERERAIFANVAAARDGGAVFGGAPHNLTARKRLPLICHCSRDNCPAGPKFGGTTAASDKQSQCHNENTRSPRRTKSRIWFEQINTNQTHLCFTGSFSLFQ